MDDRASDRQPLPLSARKALRYLAVMVRQPCGCEQSIGSLGHAIDAIHSARKKEVFSGGQCEIKAAVVPKKTNVSPRSRRSSPRLAEPEDFAFARTQGAGEAM